jgi:alpha-tubulin suppressor-like RCC1 family protein
MRSATRLLLPVALVAVILVGCDRSVRFGGTGAGRADRIEIAVDPPTPVDVGAGAFTIELWLKATTADNPTGTPTCGAGQYGWISGHVLVDRDRYPLSGPDGRDFGASVSSAGEVAFGAENASGTSATACTDLSGEGVLDGTWHHLALQRTTAGELQIWVDGAKRAQIAGPSGDLSYPDDASGARATDPYLVFGAEKHDVGPAYPSYRGLMDEIRISDIARYGVEGPRPVTRFVSDPNTVGLYHLDEAGTLAPGSTAVVGDASGHPSGPTPGTLRATADGSLPQRGLTDTPFAPPPAATLPAVAAGWFHACAVVTDGTARCWGQGTDGQLGDGTTTDSSTPVTVAGITTATAITAGNGFSCALLASGAVRCWGSNTSGQLGDGTTTDSSTPVTVTGITTATSISASRSHTCARLTDGSVACWGRNFFGQLGDGTDTDSPTPVTVTGITTATSVTTGSAHTCARLGDGTVRCWGGNYYGQLGDGTMTDSPTPVTVAGLTAVTSIAAGVFHTCARLDDASLRCWGHNSTGQLGDGTVSWVTTPEGGTITWASVPVEVPGITSATSVAAGAFHTCARLADATLRCWGDGEYGELGDGSGLPSLAPVTVTGITTATSIVANRYQTCASLAEGSLRCWGQNGWGQLGDGTTTDSFTPVAVNLDGSG